jgi:UDP-2,3-diacylglucosamine hydrolase
MASVARKLGIFAGGGALPRRMAETCQGASRPYTILALQGFADMDMSGHPHHWVGLGEAGKAINLLKSEGAQDIVFCGRVQRPNWSDIKVDWGGMKLLPRLALAGARGDDALLAFIVKEMEGHGFRVVGPDQVLTDLLARTGLWTQTSPSDDDTADIARGREVVSTLGRLDIGQGAVISRGLVLAVEAAEGTDRMLARVGELPHELLGVAGNRRGVFVKMSKPGQERRIDLPTVGIETVRRCVAAGLKGIAVEADGALVLDREAMVRAADAEGMFIIGFAKDAT